MDALDKPLKTKLIFLIEADGFLANYLGDAIKADGAQILGPARTADEANALIGRLRVAPHAAVVSADILEVAGPAMSTSFERLGIPLLLTCGNVRELPPSSADHDALVAPFAAYQVVDHLRAVLAKADQAAMDVPK